MPNSRLHRVVRIVFALAIGIGLALYAYQRISDPLPRQQRMQEEAVVLQAREILISVIAPASDIEIVDPLNKNRVAGKVYIYPIDNGWQVSGHYRRPGEIPWQPWLMTLDNDAAIVTLSVQDKALQEIAKRDARIIVKPPD